MHFSFAAGVVYNNKIIFSENYLNGLFEMEIETGRTRYITNFPDEDRTKKLMHKRAFIYKEKIVFAPNQGDHVHIYNIETGEILAVQVLKNNNSRYAFLDMALVDNILYIIPGTAEQPIITLDMDDHSVRVITHKLDVIIGEHIPYEIHFYGAIYHEDKIWITGNNTSMVYAIDIRSGEADVFNTPIENLAKIFRVDGSIFLTSLYGGIYSWNQMKNEYFEHKKEESSSYLSYCVLENDNGSMFFVPDTGGQLYLTNSFSEKTILDSEKIIDIKDDFNPRMLGYTRDVAYPYRDGIVIYPTFERDFVIVSEGKARIVRQELTEKSRFFEDNSSALYEILGNELHVEGTQIGLEDLCNLLSVER